MDTTVKQRILGIIILVAILGFCLTALLRNSKPTQPHIAKINTQPFAQQNTAGTPSAKPTMPPITEEKPVAPVNTITTPSTPVASMPAPAPAPTPTKATTMTLPPPVPSQKITEVKPSTVTTTPVKTPAPALTPAATVQETLPAPAPQEALFSQQPISKQPVSKKTLTASPVVKEHKAVPHKHPHPTQPLVKAKTKTNTTSALANQKDLMVQVGTFSVAGNAKSLVDKLHAKGFSASAQKMHTSKGEMTRVIVGKKGLNYTQAEELRRELHQSMQLPGIIVSHAKD